MTMKCLIAPLKCVSIKAGYMTQSAADGELALEKLEKEEFDLLVLDLIMPKMTGFDVLREMRKRNIRRRIIVLSRLNQPNDVRVAKELGAAECLPKESPSFMDDIVEYAGKLSVA
jgi:CheY-like chemotaxis protein